MLSDPTPAVQHAYETVIARLTPAERVAMTMEMMAVTDELVRAGIRLRFPEAAGEELEYQVLPAKYGDALARRVYGRSV